MDEYEHGKIDQRLAGHDKHLSQINGSLEKVADNLAKLNLGIQQLIDSAAADRATVVTTAKALKDADDVRRDRGDARWTPVQRLAAILGGMAAAVGVLYEILHH
jgi:hypothetical protein